MTKPVRSPRSRPTLKKINEEMKQWSALLSDELLGWPQVAARPMFGMLAFYRGRKIFAALPRTRAMGAANSVSFKLRTPSGRDKLRAPSTRQAKELRADPRVRWNPMARSGWISFELEAGRDLNRALHWFTRAYEAAK
jgi:hypothetical protein